METTRETTREDICTWCEEETAVVHGYDEHNGAWSLCATCRADAEDDKQVIA